MYRSSIYRRQSIETLPSTSRYVLCDAEAEDILPDKSLLCLLQGTGSLIIDHVNSRAYVAASERSNIDLAQEWAQKVGISELIHFDASDAEGHPIYHTNVLMALGSTVAVVCTESVHDLKERQHLVSRLSETHEVLEISREQMGHFCGNVLEVQNGKGLPVLAMSTNARYAILPSSS